MADNRHAGAITPDPISGGAFISQPPGKRGESERMYKVMCRGSRRAWVDYSGKFETMEQAEECKERAEKRRACDIHGKEIEYKIFAI